MSDREFAVEEAAILRGGATPIGRVLVLGLGKSGKSVVKYCAERIGSRVESMFVAAGARSDDAEAFCASHAGPELDYAFGDEALDAFDAAEKPFDICIASPGIPYWSELYQRGLALSGELISEVEFAWRESSLKSIWVAISGTNGKTTTTACCAHVLKACGLEAEAVGNIGDVCLDAVAAGRTQVYVAEVSSYQLYSTRLFSPDIAVMLNITPDHVHWHKTFEAYRDAKFKMLDHMQETQRYLAVSPGGVFLCDEFACSMRPIRQPVAVLDAVNDVVRAKVRELKALTPEEGGFDYIPMGSADGIGSDMRARCGSANAAFIDDAGVLHIAYGGVDNALLSADELLIKGAHNASNALAAAAVAIALGCDAQDVARALRSFAPLEHRIEPCGSVDGVACYNDSKATNVDATVKALESFPGERLVVLLGGDDKGTPLDELAACVLEHAHAAVCFGQAGPRFAEALSSALGEAPSDFVLEQARHLEDALDCALSIAEAGDVVLLSPACASFDEFSSFEQRGTVFKQLVSARMGAKGASVPEER